MAFLPLLLSDPLRAALFGSRFALHEAWIIPILPSKFSGPGAKDRRVFHRGFRRNEDDSRKDSHSRIESSSHVRLRVCGQSQIPPRGSVDPGFDFSGAKKSAIVHSSGRNGLQKDFRGRAWPRVHLRLGQIECLQSKSVWGRRSAGFGRLRVRRMRDNLDL